MRLDPKIIHNTKATQERIFRLAKRDHGLTLKAISMDAGVDYDSLCNYAKGETQMPVGVLYALVGVVPSELLSLLLPSGHVIVQIPENIDHDEIAEAMHDFLREKERAHHPESPAGREIADCEDNVLRGKFARVRAA